MALGYEIGTVMRRTSTLMTSSSGDVTVKFDDVEHLGNYIQVCVVWGGRRSACSGVCRGVAVCVSQGQREQAWWGGGTSACVVPCVSGGTKGGRGQG
jgi:hypothetical protein